MTRSEVTAASLIEKHLSEKRQPLRKLARLPWRRRTAYTRRQLTKEEKKTIRLRRMQKKMDYQSRLCAVHDLIWEQAHMIKEDFPSHSIEYYYEDIMSQPMKTQQERDPNRWNAFLRSEVRAINDALPEGASRYKVTNPKVMGPLKEKWHAMTKEERVDATKDSLQELAGARENRQTGEHQVPLALLGDVKRTLTYIEDQLSRLHERTGMEILLVGVRGSVKHYNTPYAYWTTDRVVTYLKEAVDMSPVELATTFEGYCINGSKSVSRNYMQQLLDLKSKTAGLIVKKLNKITNGRVTKMSYQGFDTITANHGVIVENWPLPLFQAPSKFNSRIEIDVLYNAWESGVTRFHQLDKDEYEKWNKERNSARIGLVNEAEQEVTEPAFLPSSSTTDIDANTAQLTMTTTQCKSATFNVGTNASGQPLTITKTSKAQRSDKGKPRKKRAAVADADAAGDGQDSTSQPCKKCRKKGKDVEGPVTSPGPDTSLPSTMSVTAEAQPSTMSITAEAQPSTTSITAEAQPSTTSITAEAQPSHDPQPSATQATTSTPFSIPPPELPPPLADASKMLLTPSPTPQRRVSPSPPITPPLSVDSGPSLALYQAQVPH